uniref:Uncharacterized protein n=1 Tax=Cacopsylla melanoneura TaxID=428564 RepID=A0A8D8UAB8_9HEMI
MLVDLIGISSSTGTRSPSERESDTRTPLNPSGPPPWPGDCSVLTRLSLRSWEPMTADLTFGGARIWNSHSRRGCVGAPSKLCPVLMWVIFSANDPRTSGGRE